jgi:apolipoprotein D and lipocalin family protein
MLQIRTFVGITLSVILLILLSVIVISAVPNESDEEKTVETVNYVDLEKYAGLWHEYARIPNSFQKDCARGTTAFYRLREDGKVDVINRCIEANGDTIEAKGIARIVDQQTRSKLEVSFVRIFGINLFWGDYWIIGLADDYRYAVVGNPSRKYGWILSRQPNLSAQDFETIKEILSNQGYNPADFRISEK